jgi:hypothetical protein
MGRLGLDANNDVDKSQYSACQSAWSGAADTVDARHLATWSLFFQENGKDAEVIFRQVVEERERVLGRERADTTEARN